MCIGHTVLFRNTCTGPTIFFMKMYLGHIYMCLGHTVRCAEVALRPEYSYRMESDVEATSRSVPLMAIALIAPPPTMARHGPPRPITAHHGPPWPEMAHHGPSRHGPSRPATARHGPSRHGPSSWPLPWPVIMAPVMARHGPQWPAMIPNEPTGRC